jgi:uncharacterized protein YukE
MALNGMDVVAAEQIAGQLELQAKAVSGVVGVVDGIVAGLMDVWEGEDFDAFASSWSQIHRTNATEVASDLQGVVTHLNQEIQAQVTASGGVSGAGVGGLVGSAGILGALLAGLNAGGRNEVETILQGLGLGTTAGAFAAILGEPLVGRIFSDVDGVLEKFDDVHDLIDNIPISDLERLPGPVKDVIGGFEKLDDIPGMDEISKKLPFISGVVGAYQTWMSLRGMPLPERVEDTVDTGSADTAISADPITAGADFISGGAVTDDANGLIRVYNGFTYGVGQGGLNEGLHDADQQLSDWADGISSQNGPIGDLARAENNFITNNYGAISQAANVAVTTVEAPVKTVDHLASGGEKLIKSIF